MLDGLQDYVYLDYAASAPLCEEAARAMAPYFVAGAQNLAIGSNANSLHTPGRAAFSALESARSSIIRALGARRPDEIIFTSGATEADDAAVLGIARAATEARRRQGMKDFIPHVITTQLEHDAVLAPAKLLESQGYHVTYLKPNKQGFIELSTLTEALDNDTVLVSIQAANSEVGSVQPVSEFAHIAHEYGALFHTDAVQALGKVPLNLRTLGVDAASFSAHKVGGPKGVGALYLRSGTPFSPYLLGGGQESGRRSGTQNVAGTVGFAAALKAAVAHQEQEAQRLSQLRDRLYQCLKEVPAVTLSVDVLPDSADYLPHIVHILVDKLESQTLILRLDKLGFGVSGGSACSSHSLEPSHVLKSIGIHPDKAQGALRISMGDLTEEAHVDSFMQAFEKSIHWN